MAKTKDIMRPAAGVVGVDRTVGEVMADVQEHGGGYVVAVDGERVVGVIDLAPLSQMGPVASELSGQKLGDLVSLTFRTCGPQDDAAALGAVFERSGAAVVVVVGPGGRVVGVIAPSDLPGAVR